MSSLRFTLLVFSVSQLFGDGDTPLRVPIHILYARVGGFLIPMQRYDILIAVYEFLSDFFICSSTYNLICSHVRGGVSIRVRNFPFLYESAVIKSLSH